MLFRATGYRLVALLAILTGASIAPQATAVELRSSCGSRTIVRSVSYSQEEESSESTPTPEDYDAIKVLAPEMMVQGDVIQEYEYVGDMGCADACYAPVPCLPAHGGMWVDLDFMVWWRNGHDLPPLVTSDPNAGILPEATILLGGESHAERPRPGGRLEFGLWLDPCQRFGVGGRYVALGDAQLDWTISSAENPVIARPFFNVGTSPGAPDAFLVASNSARPATTGNISVLSDSQFHAADVFLRWALMKSCPMKFDFVLGYQFARIDEDLTISSFTDRTGLLETLAVTDVFDTRNEYHGVDFGWQGEYRRGVWGLELLARFGFGNMSQQVTIAGETISTATDGSARTDTGLLAQATNSGTYTQNDFSYMQDIGVKLNYYPINCMKLSFGYGLMYFSSVVRPGNEIDLGVPVPTTPEATRPAFAFDPTNFYVQGLTLGMEYRF